MMKGKNAMVIMEKNVRGAAHIYQIVIDDTKGRQLLPGIPPVLSGPKYPPI